jgi:hypothetical protein
MLIKRSALRLNCAAVAAILIGFSGSRPVQAGDLFQKPQVLFMQQDRVVTFELTPPNGDQPLGGGVGAQVGTATGAINGTSVVNFKFTFTSNPFVRPLTFNFDNRVGITDVDGDQIIFQNVGTGRFNAPLIDPTLPVAPTLVAPYQVFGSPIAPATGGPLTGTYRVVATSGKYIAQYPLGQVFQYKAISFNPATPPTAPGTTGSSYVEVYK